MSFSPQELMARAIQLAERGLYTTMPNPRVGSVVADAEGNILGEGWHRRAGLPHAEIEALADAGDRARGATVYVTLEPCSHTGKTGPCADALIEAGVAKVVFGMEDPNPAVAGSGLQKLKDAGIEVEGPLLEEQCRALNPGFIKRMNLGLPLVRSKSAMSLDGRTAMASGESKWVTGPAARADVQRLRARSCAIVTGVDTVRHDNPNMNLRPEEMGLPAEEAAAVRVDGTTSRVEKDGARADADFVMPGNCHQRWTRPSHMMGCNYEQADDSGDASDDGEEARQSSALVRCRGWQERAPLAAHGTITTENSRLNQRRRRDRNPLPPQP